MTKIKKVTSDKEFLNYLKAIDDYLKEEELKYKTENKNDLNCRVKPIYIGEMLGED